EVFWSVVVPTSDAVRCGEEAFLHVITYRSAIYAAELCEVIRRVMGLVRHAPADYETVTAALSTVVICPVRRSPRWREHAWIEQAHPAATFVSLKKSAGIGRRRRQTNAIGRSRSCDT